MIAGTLFGCEADVISAVAACCGALFVLVGIVLGWWQLAHYREKEFLDKIRDEKFKFPEQVRSLDGEELSSYLARPWMLNRPKPIQYDFRGYDVRVRDTMIEVLMAHDRVAHDCHVFGLSRSVVRYQGPEFKRLWKKMKPVVEGLRNDREHGVERFCKTLEDFVEREDFAALLSEYHETSSEVTLVNTP